MFCIAVKKLRVLVRGHFSTESLVQFFMGINQPHVLGLITVVGFACFGPCTHFALCQETNSSEESTQAKQSEEFDSTDSVKITRAAPLARHRHHYDRRKHATTSDDTRFVTNRQSDIVLPLPEENDAFVFAVFGDRTGGPPEGVQILDQAVEDVNLFEPDLVMTVGDMIQGYNTTDSWIPEMRQYKNSMGKLLCPWFPVAGNHDVYWRGPDKPTGEHEKNYEMHFGPLWYAFEHKNSWFIVLYSDEGDPSDGYKSISDPRAQRMSPEQLEWLKSTLQKASGAQHVFLFLHHPRWIGGRYGDDWNKVHDLLKSAGNVRAVFAGHIHRMRYDGPKDGIEYVTLATVGGGQSGISADGGFLHHFHLVTVREQQIAMACLPVGEVKDVRKIKGEISDEISHLVRTPPSFQTRPTIDPNGNAQSPTVIELFNPVSRPVEFELSVDSKDGLWTGTPDHVHQIVHPGDRVTQTMLLQRYSKNMTAAYQPPRLKIRADYLAEGARIALSEQSINIPIRLKLDAPKRSPDESTLLLDGNDHFAVDSGLLDLPDGPFTLECWCKARTFGSRVGLITKTQGSEYGLFVSNGNPYFTVHAGGQYREAENAQTQMETDRWYHIAGVFDGRQVRTYLDGQLVSRVEGGGERRTNGLPLLIGADVDSRAQGVSHFTGEIDGVRLSKIPRYLEDSFSPVRRHETDKDTLLLLNFDDFVGPWAYDESESQAHAMKNGNPQLQTVK